MLSVKQGGIKYHFWVVGMTRPGLETRSPGEHDHASMQSYHIQYTIFIAFLFHYHSYT